MLQRQVLPILVGVSSSVKSLIFYTYGGQVGFQLLYKGFRVKIGNLERVLSFFDSFLIFAELKHCGRV